MSTPPSISDLANLVFGIQHTGIKNGTLNLFMAKSRAGRSMWYALPPTCPVGDRDMPYTVDLPVGMTEWYAEVQEWAHAELAAAGHAYAYEPHHWIDADAVVLYPVGTQQGTPKSRWRWSFDDLTAATLFKLRWVG